MNFRQPKSHHEADHRAWLAWLSQYRVTLKGAGLPPSVMLTESHWIDFLQNGQLEWHPESSDGFSFDQLSAGQMSELLAVLESSPKYTSEPMTGWLRHRLGRHLIGDSLAVVPSPPEQRGGATCTVHLSGSITEPLLYTVDVVLGRISTRLLRARKERTWSLNVDARPLRVRVEESTTASDGETIRIVLSAVHDEAADHGALRKAATELSSRLGGRWTEPAKE